MERAAVLNAAITRSGKWPPLTRLLMAIAIAMSSQIGGGFDSFVTPMETAKLKPGLASMGAFVPRPMNATAVVLPVHMNFDSTGISSSLPSGSSKDSTRTFTY